MMSVLMNNSVPIQYLSTHIVLELALERFFRSDMTVLKSTKFPIAYDRIN